MVVKRSYRNDEVIVSEVEYRSAFEDSMYGRAVVVVNKEDYTITIKISNDCHYGLFTAANSLQMILMIMVIN